MPEFVENLIFQLVYISTDYVFDGQGTRPWEPDDPVVKPLNVYGQAKYDGEVAVEKYAPKHYNCTYCMGIWT